MTKDDVIRKVCEAGFWQEEDDIFICGIEHIVKLLEAEREACAKLCEDLTEWHSKTVIAALDSAAENIRARSLDVHN